MESVGDSVAKNKWSSTCQESSLSVLADRVDRRGGRGQVWAETLAPCRRTDYYRLPVRRATRLEILPQGVQKWRSRSLARPGQGDLRTTRFTRLDRGGERSEKETS